MSLNDELYSVIPKSDYNNIKGLAYNIWRKSFSYISLEDLIQEGAMAYLKEKKKYDKTKNNYFMGYAYKRVKGAMLDFVAKNSINGAGTVRSRKTDKGRLVSAPEGVENYHVNEDAEDELIEMLYKEEIFEAFLEYLEALTPSEKFILVEYFVKGNSLKATGAKSGEDRSRVKIIITACVSFLRDRFKVLLEDIDFASVGYSRL